MRAIEIMFADGMLGNKAVLLALSSLTTGNLNSKIQKTARPFTMKDILPTVHEYIVPPLTPEQQREQANKQLLAFLQSRPGAEAYMETQDGAAH
jgi:hypothetical protein